MRSLQSHSGSGCQQRRVEVVAEAVSTAGGQRGETRALEELVGKGETGLAAASRPGLACAPRLYQRCRQARAPPCLCTQGPTMIKAMSPFPAGTGTCVEERDSRGQPCD